MEALEIIQKEEGLEGVTLNKSHISPPKEDDVIVQMKACPINVADLAILSGHYGLALSFPKALGNEGAGTVVAKGALVKSLEIGDQVIMIKGLGSWATYLKKKEEAFIKVPNFFPESLACFTRSALMTAFRLLQDFQKENSLKTVIQNASNGAVGLSVIALAKAKGIKTINIIRNPSQKEELIQRGADYVLLEDAIFQNKFDLGEIPNADLALDAIGGPYADLFAEKLTQNGVIVSYGSLSKKPIEIKSRALIYKNITLKGFWVTKWLESLSKDEASKSFSELFSTLKDSSFEIPIDRAYPLKDFKEALAHAKRGSRKGKIIFNP
ncbi:MDR family NADPH-dependent oxidoreductase [Criblamydia sequanensis]|uniref:enoyl-[acyl-carrier-protein] reductase n=1 Tax=Candidatus Criblamydia sequanensis CRIB-18 TaxID=1437425 RepID=A0A090CYG1_9BACT|nr:2-enoyl thioester reductase domain-containing protein [Criblamydia sequanensis]CDR33411.1 Alcohol dehydrogenase [Criblamydia sequanensis CRIB-18]